MSDSEPPCAKRMRYNLCRSDHTPQNAVELVQSKPEQSKTQLMDLNDDCLLEIIEFLKTGDLSALTKVNLRLNGLMKYYAQLKYKVQITKDFDFKPSNDKKLSIEVVKEVLAIFGDEIISLILSSSAFDVDTDVNSILYLVQKHCKVKKLMIKDFGIQSLDLPLFAQLEMLILMNCSSNRNWSKMNKLQVLKLDEFIFRRWPSRFREGVFSVDPIPLNRIQSLKEVRLSDCNVQNSDLTKLILNNPGLKKVSVVKCLQISPFIFEEVSQLKSLEKFEFQKRKKGIYDQMLGFGLLKPLTSMQTLRCFTLTYNTFSTLELTDGFVKNGVALQLLHLGLGQFKDGTAENIGKLSSIKALLLNNMSVNESHLLHMVTKLKRLQILYVKTNDRISSGKLEGIIQQANRLNILKIDAPGLTLDFDTYTNILSTVQKRTEPTKLQLYIYGDNEQSNVVTKEINNLNEEWLIVEECHRNRDPLFQNLESKVSFPPPPPRGYYSSEDSDDDYYY